jgi:NAD(P)-dependent dehydrogenase (short-subunit alcohol dehydrogenase family)
MDTNDSQNMQGKICMVTGANTGIGKAIALGLAHLGGTVVMVCRDQGKGQVAQAEIKTASDNQAVDLIIADLSRMASVRELAAQFKSKYPKLDVLVNNAAVYKSKRLLTPDGFETMFATNHLAPFLLTNLLLDSLQASGEARVLNISAPSTVQLNFEDLQGEKRFSSLNAFGATKMGNLLFTFELARRLEGHDVVVNAIHPGLVKSNLMREAPTPMRWITNLFSASPERAASGIVSVAAAPEFAGQSGRFYRDGKEISAPAYARDRDNQRRLWEVSAELTKHNG